MAEVNNQEDLVNEKYAKDYENVMKGIQEKL